MSMTGAERAKKCREEKKKNNKIELRIFVPKNKFKKCSKAVNDIINGKK